MNASEVFEALSGTSTKAAAITSTTTGSPFLSNLDVGKWVSFVSVRYYEGYGELAPSFSEVKKFLEEIVSRSGKFDLVFVDPFHLYKSSLDALTLADQVSDEDSFIVVHDCLPPIEYTSEYYVEGNWCGSTFAAFRDFALKSEREWFVLNDDFGIGILGPRVNKKRPDDCPLLAEWNASSLAEKIAMYGRESTRLMRAVSVQDLSVAIERVRLGLSVSSLASESVSTPTAVAPKPIVDPLHAANGRRPRRYFSKAKIGSK